jgi:hypothetical protein
MAGTARSLATSNYAVPPERLAGDDVELESTEHKQCDYRPFPPTQPPAKAYKLGPRSCSALDSAYITGSERPSVAEPVHVYSQLYYWGPRLNDTDDDLMCAAGPAPMQ